MLAYCGRLLRALRALTAGPGCGLAAPPVRRTRRTPDSASFCDRFPYIVHAMRGKRSQKAARAGRLLRALRALTGGPGQPLRAARATHASHPSLRRSLVRQAPGRATDQIEGYRHIPIYGLRGRGASHDNRVIVEREPPCKVNVFCWA